jgi:hypothetical protein
VETEETPEMDTMEQAFRPAVKIPGNAALAAEVVRDYPGSIKGWFLMRGTGTGRSSCIIQSADTSVAKARSVVALAAGLKACSTPLFLVTKARAELAP